MAGLLPAKTANAISIGKVDETNPIEMAYAQLLKDGTCSDESVVYATSVYKDSYKREVLEAFMLARAVDTEITDVLKIPPAVIQVYRHLFFDMAVFRDELDLEAYVHRYPKTGGGWGHDIKLCALSLGMDFLRYRFSRGNPPVDIMPALTGMIANANFLAKAAKINPMDTNSAKEARQWMQTALKAMEVYTKVKPIAESNRDEFEMILQSLDIDKKEETVAIPKDDILH